MTNPTLTATRSPAVPQSRLMALCAAVFLAGAMFTFLTGFVQTSAAHNAAHDTRHSLAFPCH